MVLVRNMQPRVATPRLINISQGTSVASLSPVQIEQEVTVVSSTYDEYDNGQRNPTYSTVSAVSNGLRRAQTDRSPARNVARSGPHQPRWKSESGIPMSPSMSKQESQDIDTLDSSRESMRALAGFLRTNEPPPDHFMSIPESDGRSPHSIQRSAFKLFGQKKSKKSKSPSAKLLRLPDSAVSAKTKRGSRYIAISIPLEYDFPESPQQQQLPQENVNSSAKAQNTGAVIVLKPTIYQPTKLSPLPEEHESLPSGLSYHDKDPKLNNTNSRTEYKFISEEAPVLEEHPTRQKSYIALSPDDMKRDTRFCEHDGDLRHSGGTQYSTLSLDTPPAQSREIRNVSIGPDVAFEHSGEISSVSTAPSVIAVRVELPLRTSSATNIPLHFQSELAKAYDDNVRQMAIQLAQALDANLCRAGNLAVAPYPEPGKTCMSQMLLESGKEIEPVPAMPKTPTSPAEQDEPESPCVSDFMPTPSPPRDRGRKNVVTSMDAPNRTRGSMLIKPDEISATMRQTRRERVKARKARDMAALRETSANRLSLSAVSWESSRRLRHTSPQTPRRHNMSIDQINRRGNSVSKIIVVAELLPYTGLVSESDLPLPSPQRSRSILKEGGSTGTPTPPRSPHGSESDTIRKSVSLSHCGILSNVSPLSPLTGSPRPSNGLDAQRQERRMRRNSAIWSKELDLRVAKLEEDNAMLMQSLSGIGRSFRQLASMLPGLGGDRDEKDEEDEDEELGLENPTTLELEKVRSLEPIMRDLQVSAGRVSNELFERKAEDFEDFDADDGESIL